MTKRVKAGGAELDRRSALKLIAASTAALAAPALAQEPEQEQDPKAPEQALFLAGEEGLDLSDQQTERLIKDVAQLRGMVKKLRDFEIPEDLEPAFSFHVLEP